MSSETANTNNNNNNNDSNDIKNGKIVRSSQYGALDEANAFASKSVSSNLILASNTQQTLSSSI